RYRYFISLACGHRRRGRRGVAHATVFGPDTIDRGGPAAAGGACTVARVSGWRGEPGAGGRGPRARARRGAHAVVVVEGGAGDWWCVARRERRAAGIQRGLGGRDCDGGGEACRNWTCTRVISRGRVYRPVLQRVGRGGKVQQDGRKVSVLNCADFQWYNRLTDIGLHRHVGGANRHAYPISEFRRVRRARTSALQRRAVRRSARGVARRARALSELGRIAHWGRLCAPGARRVRVGPPEL